GISRASRFRATSNSSMRCRGRHPRRSRRASSSSPKRICASAPTTASIAAGADTREGNGMSELWRKPAVELARTIRDKKVSSRELVEMVLDRIGRLDEDTNAFALVDAPGALDAARKADEALARGEILGPLHGIPVTVKDLLPTAGIRTALGSHIFADNVPA